MKYTPDTLYCNMPRRSLGYVFNLPEVIFTDRHEADANHLIGDETMTLAEAFSRIRHDIHHDA